VYRPRSVPVDALTRGHLDLQRMSPLRYLIGRVQGQRVVDPVARKRAIPSVLGN
jgi:hypothetical protein